VSLLLLSGVIFLWCVWCILLIMSVFAKRKKKLSDENTVMLNNEARRMVDLILKGHILRHVLTNDSTKRNEKKFRKSYGTFLNKTNIDGINKIEGTKAYE